LINDFWDFERMGSGAEAGKMIRAVRRQGLLTLLAHFRTKGRKLISEPRLRLIELEE